MRRWHAEHSGSIGGVTERPCSQAGSLMWLLPRTLKWSWVGQTRALYSPNYCISRANCEPVWLVSFFCWNQILNTHNLKGKEFIFPMASVVSACDLLILTPVRRTTADQSCLPHGIWEAVRRGKALRGPGAPRARPQWCSSNWGPPTLSRLDLSFQFSCLSLLTKHTLLSPPWKFTFKLETKFINAKLYREWRATQIAYLLHLISNLPRWTVQTTLIFFAQSLSLLPSWWFGIKIFYQVKNNSICCKQTEGVIKQTFAVIVSFNSVWGLGI